MKQVFHTRPPLLVTRKFECLGQKLRALTVFFESIELIINYKLVTPYFMDHKNKTKMLDSFMLSLFQSERFAVVLGEMLGKQIISLNVLKISNSQDWSA